MSAAPAVTAKKSKMSKPKVPAAHPPVIDMVKSAIVAAKDRKGTSLATIKKFISANYKVDVEKLGPHIRRGIVHAVEKGALVRVGNKGKGASGSFKVADKKSVEVKPKPKAPTKPKAPQPKKTATPKKPKVAVKKAVKPKTPKPKAVKKAVKPAVKKPKTPKKAAAKKAAPKKK